MYYHLIPVPLAIAGIAVYWRARQKGDLRLVSIVQPAITILCILVALLALNRPGTNGTLVAWITAGLVIALIGDFLNLDMGNPNVVLRGLVIAILAYLTYAVGFTWIDGFHEEDIYVGIAALLVYAVIMRYLWPNLGSMRIPVLIYGLVLPFVVTRAISTFFGYEFSVTQSVLLTAGTAMLYIGDIEFGLHTYGGGVPMLFGPILYSGGQLLIALSTSY